MIAALVALLWATPPDLAHEVAAVAADVARARQLPARGRVTAVEVSRRTLDGMLAARVARRPPLDAPLFERLGLWPPGVDPAEALLEVLRAEVDGYYDPDTRRIYLVEGLEAEVRRDLLAREAARALADQHFAVKGLLGGHPSTDERLARRALFEGDATAVLLELRDVVPAPRGARLANHLSRGPEDTPRWLRETLAFPTWAGVALVARVLEHQPWSRVDALWRDPPASTEQVLHPEKYEAGDRPMRLGSEPVAALRDEGLRPGAEDTLGELGLQLFLEESGVPADLAQGAAEGWSGDRVVGYTGEEGAPPVVVWLTAWDSEADAREFEVAARAAASRLEPGGNALVRRKISRVVLVIGASGAPGEAACDAALGWPSRGGGPPRARPEPRASRRAAAKPKAKPRPRRR